MNSLVVSTSRGRNRNRAQNIFRSAPDDTDNTKISIKKSKRETKDNKMLKSNRRSNKHRTSTHKSKCIRNFYHIISKPRDVIKEYNIVLY